FALDVIHGYRTSFPVPLAEACAWDPVMAELSAEAAGREAYAAGLRWTFAPMVDIARDPRWGRIVEGAGEDPYLGAAYAAARVRGFQRAGIAACIKHYAGYGGAEAGREYNTADIPLRRMLEVYLPPFRAGVEAGAATLMSGFNSLNSVPVSGSRFLLTDVLRTWWGFKGMVVSDWGSIGELQAHGVAGDGVNAALQGIWAGVDMDMHAFVYRDHIKGLLDSGLLSTKQLDQAVRRVLSVKASLGLLDRPYADETLEIGAMLRPETIALAKRSALASAVLLKNDKVLPFSKEIAGLAVIGPLADSQVDPLGPWSAQGDKNEVVSVLQGLKAKLGAKSKVTFEKGCDLEGASTAGFSAALDIARRASAVVLVVGEGRDYSGEAHSRTDLDLPGVQRQLVEAVLKLGKPTVVVLMNGRPLALEWMDKKAPAILEAWYLGGRHGEAVADLLFGDAEPQGRLVTCFPRNVGQVPIYYAQQNTGRPATEQRYTSKYIDAPNTPLYPFGYGLSYTRFEYSGLKVPAHVQAGEKVRVQVTVKNVGARNGVETAQLYVGDPVASVSRPMRELKGFQKAELKPGESRELSFLLTPSELSFIGRDYRFGYEPGTFKVWVGSDSNATLEGAFSVEGEQDFYALDLAPKGDMEALPPRARSRAESPKKRKAIVVKDGATGPVSE
ncbi:MAG: glycoside hydrolase family 3 N-terminal domain-containing protein, partial [candidate division FCPU426 bacterium]